MIPTTKNSNILVEIRMMISIVIQILIGIVPRIHIRIQIVMIVEKGGIEVLVVIDEIMDVTKIAMTIGTEKLT
jgi:hypothetical protein